MRSIFKIKYHKGLDIYVVGYRNTALYTCSNKPEAEEFIQTFKQDVLTEEAYRTRKVIKEIKSIVKQDKLWTKKGRNT